LEVKATWDELFYDLVIVSSIGMISSNLRWGEADEDHRLLSDTEPSPASKIIHFCLLFASIFNVWASYTSFNSRVNTNSLCHSTFLLIKMVAIAGMGANADPNDESLKHFFAFASLAWGMEALSSLEVYAMVHVTGQHQFRRVLLGQCKLACVRDRVWRIRVWRICVWRIRVWRELRPLFTPLRLDDLERPR